MKTTLGCILYIKNWRKLLAIELPFIFYALEGFINDVAVIIAFLKLLSESWLQLAVIAICAALFQVVV